MKTNTIKIKREPTSTGRDFRNINESDFDPKIHKRYSGLSFEVTDAIEEAPIKPRRRKK